MNGAQVAQKVFEVERFTALTLDPLIFRPWEIARLTDWQIDALYYGPMVKRQAAMEAEIAKAKGGRGTLPPAAGAKSADSDADLGSMDQESFAHEMQKRFGGDLEKHRGVWTQIQAARNAKTAGG